MNTAELQQYLQEILTALAVLGPGIILAIGIMLVIGVILIIQGVLRLWQKRLLAAGFRGQRHHLCRSSCNYLAYSHEYIYIS